MGHADRALYRRAGACRSRSRTIDQRLGDDRDAVDRDPRSTQAHRARAVADRSASPYDPALRASSQEPGLAAGGRSQEMALDAALPAQRRRDFTGMGQISLGFASSPPV